MVAAAIEYRQAEKNTPPVSPGHTLKYNTDFLQVRY